MSKHHTAAWQRKWRKIRPVVLEGEPLCRLCAAAGYTVGATTVDHIVPLGSGGTDDWDNLQPLCRPCHDKKTLEENKRAVPVGVDGWPYSSSVLPGGGASKSNNKPMPKPRP